MDGENHPIFRRLKPKRAPSHRPDPGPRGLTYAGDNIDKRLPITLHLVEDSRTDRGPGSIPAQIKSGTKNIVVPILKEEQSLGRQSPHILCNSLIERNPKSAPKLVESGYWSRWPGGVAGMNWAVYFETVGSVRGNQSDRLHT